MLAVHLRVFSLLPKGHVLSFSRRYRGGTSCSFLACGDHPNPWKNAPRLQGKWKSFMWIPINSENRSGSCSENCGFRIAQVVRCHSENGISRHFRESFSELRELLREYPGTLAHRNHSDFCDLRLRCPSRTPEIASDFQDFAWGGVIDPAASSRPPPGQRSHSSYCVEGVVRNVVLLLSGLFLLWCVSLLVRKIAWKFTGCQDRQRAGSTSFGVLDYWNMSCYCATGGGSRGGGSPRTPRYHGPLGRLPKGAGRPMGPATLRWRFLRDFGMCIWVFVGYFRDFCWFFFSVRCFVSGEGILFGLVPFKTWPMSEILFVVSLSLSLSFCLSGLFGGNVSLFLFLRRWGNPNPFWGLGFLLCLSNLATHYEFDPYVFTFSFIFVGARVGVFSGILFSPPGLSVCLSFLSCFVFLHAFDWCMLHIFLLGVGRLDISHPCRIVIAIMFWGLRTSDPHASWRAKLVSPPPTPFLSNAVKDSPGRGWGKIAYGNRTVTHCLFTIVGSPKGENLMLSVFFILCFFASGSVSFAVFCRSS